MRPTAVLLLLLLMPLALAGQGFQSVESIRAAALGAIGDNDAPGVRAEASVDPAMRLPACGRALEAVRGSNGSVEVSCPDGWRLFVPVRVQRMAPVVVLSRSVGAGQPIPADALSVEMRDTARLSTGGLSDPGRVQGQVARRALMAGSVVSAADLMSARTLRRGDTVTLVSRAGGIEVRATGRAMGDAGPNDRVSVENLASRRVVQGVLRESGEVDVVF
ncbi:MAG: flagellar basal body P-ring formation chaperone FlgA [Lysobacteraceae bacterium]